jgi:glutamyl-tRNA synthetase
LEKGTDYFPQVVALVRSRSKTLCQMLASMDYFWSEVVSYDSKGIEKYFLPPQAILYLSEVRAVVQSATSFSADELELLFRGQADHMQIKAAHLIHPTRLALCGQTASPGLFEVMELLGQSICVSRLDQAITYIEQLPQAGNKT